MVPKPYTNWKTAEIVPFDHRQSETRCGAQQTAQIFGDTFGLVLGADHAVGRELEIRGGIGPRLDRNGNDVGDGAFGGRLIFGKSRSGQARHNKRDQSENCTEYIGG